MKKLLLLFFLPLFCVASLWAQELSKKEKSYLKKAVSLYKKKDYNESFKILYKLFENNLNHKDINFYLGRAAFEINDFDTAVQAFERILILDESNHRVRLELARVFFIEGLYGESKSEFQKVLDSNPPKDVKLKIHRYLAEINGKEESSKKKVFFMGLISLGAGYDTNVENSHDEFITITYENNATAQFEGKEKEDSYSVQNVYLKYRNDIGETYGYFLDTTFLAYNQIFKEYDSNNFTYLKLSPAFGYVNKKYTLNSPFYVEKVLSDDKSYMTNFGFSPSINIKSSNKTLYSFGYKFASKNHDQDTYEKKDSYLNEFSFGLNKIINDINLGVNYKLALENIKNGNDQYYVDSVKNSLALSAGKKFFNIYSTNLNYTFKNSEYDYRSRVDKQHNITLSLGRDILKNTALNMVYNFVDNDSNDNIYSYQKNNISFSLNWSF